MSNILYLNLKGEYFDQIKSGVKEFEYRLFNDYWKKRLFKRSSEEIAQRQEYEKIVIRRGYPKAGDLENEIVRPWLGFNIITKFKHPHFGDTDVSVFAIKVN